MIGTLINVGTVLLGTGVGFLCKKGIPQRIEDAVMKTMGLAVVLIGLTGTLGAMGRVEGGAVSFDGGLLLLVSLVLGALAGELLKIDDRLGRFGGFVERKLKIKGFAQGFVPAAVIFCVGAMAILGALEEGLTGDYSILLVKSTLDLVSAAVLTASLGPSVGFAALAVLLYQGALTLGAGALAPLMTDALMGQISMVGNAIILVIGVNFLFGERIKTANLLPAIFVPPLYNLLMMVIKM